MAAAEETLRALMLGGLGGDARAHEAMLREVASLLRGYFRRRLAGAETDVEDLVQESLIGVHTRRLSYDRNRAFMPWVYAIARHKLADHFRSRGVSMRHEELEEWHASSNFESACSCKMDVETLLETLPAKQRDVIRSAKINGDAISEIAASTGLSASDVKVSIHRGLKSLAARVRKS